MEFLSYIKIRRYQSKEFMWFHKSPKKGGGLWSFQGRMNKKLVIILRKYARIKKWDQRRFFFFFWWALVGSSMIGTIRVLFMLLLIGHGGTILLGQFPVWCEMHVLRCSLRFLRILQNN